jgi:hypothetical protein
MYIMLCSGAVDCGRASVQQTARRYKPGSDISATESMVTERCQLSGTWPVSYGMTDCNICCYLPAELFRFTLYRSVQITLVQSKATTQVCCNAVGVHCMCAACFGLYLVHPQAGQYSAGRACRLNTLDKQQCQLALCQALVNFLAVGNLQCTDLPRD